MRRRTLMSALALLMLTILAVPAFTQDSLSQGDWASRLTAALGWAEALPSAGTPADHIWLLTGRDKISIPAAKARQSAQDAKATTRLYELEVKRPGAYLLKVWLKGGPTFVTVDTRPSVLVARTERSRWEDVGTFALSKGTHVVSVTTPRASPAPAVELISGCGNIAPPGGWKASQKLTFGDKAATLVRAIKLQGELPAGSRFDIPGKAGRRTLRVTQEGAFTIEVQSPGGAKLHYRVDGCEETLAAPAGVNQNEWRAAGTVTLLPGEHVITLIGPPKIIAGAKLRLASRRGTAQDYVDVLQSLGVAEGDAASAVGPAAANANLEHPAVRSLLAGVGLAAAKPGPGPTSSALLPTDRVDAPWSSPVSPILAPSATESEPDE